jgi:uncharacterized membrane protein YidH (DUF202 family)
MSDAPTSEAGLGGFFDFVNATTPPTSAASSTAPATQNPFTPENTNAIATTIVSGVNAALGAFGIGPNSDDARAAEARRQAAGAATTKMLAVGAVLVSVVVVVILLVKRR